MLADVADESHLSELYALLGDKDVFVREGVAVPLARLEGVRALPMLLGALIQGDRDGHDNDGLCGTIATLLDETKREAAPMLLDLLHSTDDEIRACAAWALGYVASEIESAPLIAALSNDQSSEVRSDAAGSLGGFKNDPAVVVALIKALNDEDTQVRISAIASLGYIGDKRAVSPLQSVFEQATGREREFAAHALKKLMGVRFWWMRLRLLS
jgi:HEAT repeat protein